MRRDIKILIAIECTFIAIGWPKLPPISPPKFIIIFYSPPKITVITITFYYYYCVDCGTRNLKWKKKQLIFQDFYLDKNLKNCLKVMIKLQLQFGP